MALTRIGRIKNIKNDISFDLWFTSNFIVIGNGRNYFGYIRPLEHVIFYSENHGLFYIDGSFFKGGIDF